MPSPSLDIAINQLSQSRLQTLIKDICDRIPEAHALAETKILINPTNPVDKSTSSMDKRRFKTCINCKEEYDVSENRPDSCNYHSGDLEPDYDGDFWADHDENCHGRIDDLKDEYPEGFRYDCCDATGDEEGCEVGPHVARIKYTAEMFPYLNRYNAPEPKKVVPIIDLTGPATSSRHCDITADAATGNKRQRSLICTRCKQAFEISQNTTRSCRQHKGTLEINWTDGWEDWDEEFHGRIGFHLVDEVPFGFFWSCCEGDAQSQGCELGLHTLEDENFARDLKRRK